MYKKRIGIIFGGPSEEHRVSLKSAAAVIRNLNTDKFVLKYIGITKKGEWKLFNGDIVNIEDGSWEKQAVSIDVSKLHDIMDFALPILHGPYGEDGCIQGFMETIGMPYGGCGVLSSAVCMDKKIFKDIMRQRGIPVCKDICITAFGVSDDEEEPLKLDFIEKSIGFPCFVKPVNMGSSVGISKVKDKKSLLEAIRFASHYDERIIIEEYIPCRELEIGVMGNARLEFSRIGEIVHFGDFYDYETKYSCKKDKTKLVIPADLKEEDSDEITKIAAEAYRAVCCCGFARVDFFKDRNTGKIYINEINTIPGFTDNSMFPLLWKACGRDFPEITERIIEAGDERYNAENNRKTKL